MIHKTITSQAEQAAFLERLAAQEAALVEQITVLEDQLLEVRAQIECEKEVIFTS